MALERKDLETLLLESERRRRFTQDSPIFADVWLKYYKDGPDERQDLLLEPHHRTPVADARQSCPLSGSATCEADHRLAYAGEYVAVRAHAARAARRRAAAVDVVAQPAAGPRHGSVFEHLEDVRRRRHADAREPAASRSRSRRRTTSCAWLAPRGRALLTDASVRGGGRAEDLDDAAHAHAARARRARPPEGRRAGPSAAAVVGEPQPPGAGDAVAIARRRSRRTPRFACSRRDVEGLAWAVVDSGIDATHPAFLRRGKDGKVPRARRGGDFDAQHDRARDVRLHRAARSDRRGARRSRPGAGASARRRSRTRWQDGLAVDWGLLRAADPGQARHGLRRARRRARHARGRHDRRRLASGRPPATPTHPLQGVCPGLALYDLRVLDDERRGRRVRRPGGAVVRALAQRPERRHR